MKRFALASLIATTVTLNAAERPNIIHIIGDDVGFDDFSCFGSKTFKTPNMDRFAQKGTMFTDFYAPAATCTPSRAAVLTGRYSFRVFGGNAVLFPSSKKGMTPKYDVCIASMLKEVGYNTAAIGKWHLGHLPRFLPTNNGFDSYFGIPYPNDHGPERLAGTGSDGRPAIALVRDLETVNRCSYEDLAELPDLFCKEAVNYITEKSKEDKPFFLHLSNIETHTPWFVPKRFVGSSGVDAYGDAVMCLDWMIGEILDTVDKLGIAENTLIIYQSDNGPLSNHDKELIGCYGKNGDVSNAIQKKRLLKSGKYQAYYEGGPKVTCVAAWAGQIKAGATCNETIAGFDWFNTFAALGGAKIPTHYPIDGRNIVDLLKGVPGAKSPHTKDGIFLFTGGFRLQGYRLGDWKMSLVRNKPELYNLKSDIGETTNVAAQNPEVYEMMRKRVAEFQKVIDAEKIRQKGFK